MKIPVFLASDNNYAPFVATTMASILLHTKEFIEFYILDCNISFKNKKKLENIKKYFKNFSIEFVSVNMKKFVQFKELRFISKAMYARYLIAELKPNIDRAIYSDVDVAFVDDIKILWQENLEGKPLGAVPSQRWRLNNNYIDVKRKFNLSEKHNYMMSGLLLIDCKKWRCENFGNKLLNTTKELMNKLELPDQEVFNVVFENNYKLLNPKYCLIYKIFDDCYTQDEIEEYTSTQVIVHYPGSEFSKPWNNKNLKSAQYFWDAVKYSNFQKEINTINIKFNNKKGEIVKKILKRIFSVKNSENKTHKIVTILGIKIKFKYKKANYISKIDHLYNEIEALKLLINTCVDIRKAPTATGELRKLQIADTLALNIFHNICDKYQLDYWLDYGTLLGAIRHNGFIPWDDDIDIAMPREDYEKIRTTLKSKLLEIGFDVNEGKGFYRQILRLVYKNSAIQIDIWPYDLYYKKNLSEQEKNFLIQDILTCHKTFFEQYPIENLQKGLISFPVDKLLELQRKIILHNENARIGALFFSGSEAITYNKPKIYSYETIYPLKKIKFENIQLNIPNNYSVYLTQIYNNYMNFPDFSDHEMRHHINIMSKMKNIDKLIRELEEKQLIIKDK